MYVVQYCQSFLPLCIDAGQLLYADLGHQLLERPVAELAELLRLAHRLQRSTQIGRCHIVQCQKITGFLHRLPQGELILYSPLILRASFSSSSPVASRWSAM